jgi:hypothetical protein
MTSTAPTFSQIKAQVSAIRKKIPNTRSVAIRAKSKWNGKTRYEEAGEAYQIYQCDSPLAMRIALRESDLDATTVLITDLDDHDISDDILVRLKPRKLIPLDNWQIVKTLFQARTVDPRLIKHAWIAEMLIELNTHDGFPPVSSGFLDADTVWKILLGRMLDLDVEIPDVLTLLKWSTGSTHVMKFRNTSSVFRAAAAEWLTAVAGPTASAILDCVARNERPDALAVGLAAGVILHPRAKGKLEKATGKLEERYLGGESPAPAVLDRWIASATEIVRLQLSDAKLKQQLLQRTDEILREVGAEAYAWLSDTSPLGFNQRMAEFGKRLTGFLSAAAPPSYDSLLEMRQSLAQHDGRAREQRRLDRVDMALRLVRWILARDEKREFSSLADAANHYLAEGGYVDWARLALRSGDPVRDLSEAYASLFDRVSDIREASSRRFGELLRDWTAVKTSDECLVPVEHALERIVAPLAAQKPVLVIVIDGMSVAVFRELMADVLGQDWVLLAEEGVGMRPGLATIPSVTEVSRTSLLCGRLMQGNSATEKAGFEEHPGLLPVCRSGYPPVLFHKAALQESDDTSLAAEIRKQIGSSHRRVVGVVVNAVDDHLLKGDQIDTRWSRDEIRVLPVLLHEAKAAGRIVVMLSDHGHVVDCRAKGQVYEGGERWRIDEGRPSDGELRIHGPRVVIPESKTLIAPWTERLRYGVKKNGYHGGISPQEMVIPIAVLKANEGLPSGWAEAAADLPAWWDLTDPSQPAAAEPVTNLKPVAPKPKSTSLPLFDLEEEPQADSPSAVEDAAVAQTPAWIRNLLASPVFEEQKRLGGRAVPSNEVFMRLLSAIEQRGGKITSSALSRAMEFPPTRLPGLLAIAQRVLNVDGFLVLARDEVSSTIELNRELLLKQFDLVE